MTRRLPWLFLGAGMAAKTALLAGGASKEAWAVDAGGEKLLSVTVAPPPGVGSDAVIERTGLSAAQVTATMLALELRGMVRQLPGPQYLRR